MRWFRLAAEQGLARAQSQLGVMYDHGEGVSEDNVEAMRWLRLAADQGNNIAQYNLGVMYANGEGVPSDLISAYMWWSLAASKGNEGARTNSNIIAERMSREQISEAQRRAMEWIQSRPPGGGD